ncbi:hypothetical protein RKD23_001833 [Streptomyces sp. SAI-170]|uniref:hypothetical protein n=1 Tax=Streptomyces sp. SAI-170 TaxID=3377729 RepID=UPI003C7A7B43
MKQRGRHRRRRRGRALRAFLTGTALALTAAATMISASQATVDEDPGPLQPLSVAGPALTEDAVPVRALDRLTASLGGPVTLGSLLADPDDTLRPAAACSPADRAALPVAPAVTRAHCWGAAGTRGWRAGAVTTSADADDDGRWGAHRVIVSGWSGGEVSGGAASGRTADAGAHGLARVAFVDAGAHGRPAVTSALLVVPADGGHGYRSLESDLSGMVWYQDKLLVTADDGLYVYDVRRVLRAGASTRAHGQRYVLPAVGAYRLGADSPRLGTLALDRGTAPDSLVATERTSGRGEGGTRLWRYSFSTDPLRPGLLATDAAGRATPTEAFRTKASGVRGVLSYGSRWYLSGGDGDGPGALWRQDTDGAQVVRCGSDDSSRCWSRSTPSLSYSAATGEVWTQSGRMLFAVELDAIDGALG